MTRAEFRTRVRLGDPMIDSLTLHKQMYSSGVKHFHFSIGTNTETLCGKIVEDIYWLTLREQVRFGGLDMICTACVKALT